MKITSVVMLELERFPGVHRSTITDDVANISFEPNGLGVLVEPKDASAKEVRLYPFHRIRYITTPKTPAAKK